MALKKEIVLPMGLTGNYVRVRDCFTRNLKGQMKRLEFEVELFLSKEAYDLGATPLCQVYSNPPANSTFTLEVSNDDLDVLSPIELAYNHLKELDKFAGAEDL